MPDTQTAFQRLVEHVAEDARKAGVFGNVFIQGDRLICTAKDAPEPASYRLELDGKDVWVTLVTADRWLSESVEADLMHTGDDLEDLLEEELADQGHAGRLSYEHFRSDDMLFTFRSRLPLSGEIDSESSSRTATRCLLAYEACFRQLGDMGGG